MGGGFVADFDVERMGVMGGEVMVSGAIADLLEPATTDRAWNIAGHPRPRGEVAKGLSRFGAGQRGGVGFLEGDQAAASWRRAR